MWVKELELSSNLKLPSFSVSWVSGNSVFDCWPWVSCTDPESPILCHLKQQPAYYHLLGHNVDIFTRVLLSKSHPGVHETFGFWMQFGLAHLSLEHIWCSLLTYALARMKAQWGDHLPHSQKKCVTQDGSHLGSHCFLQKCL